MQIELPLQGFDAVDQQLDSRIFQGIRCQDGLILRGARKRGELVNVFPLGAQCFPARREQVERHMAEQFFCESGSAINEMFATVEHKEFRRSSQTVDQERKYVGCLDRKPECARHGGRNQRWVIKWTEVHEPNFTVED